MQMSRSFRISGIVLCLAFTTAVACAGSLMPDLAIPRLFHTQHPQDPVVGEYALAENFLPQNAIPAIYHVNCEPRWIPHTSLFWYEDVSREGTHYVLVNVTAKTKSVVTPDQLHDLFGTLIDPARDPALLVSPDGTKGVLLRGYNLYLWDLASGEETPLTRDGTTDHFYGRQSDTTLEITSQQRSGDPVVPYAAWSPDSTRLVTFRVDQRDVLPLYLLQNAPENNTLRPVQYTYHYSMPGEEHVAHYESVFIDTRTGSVTRVQYRPWPETSMMDAGIFNLQWWSQNGSQVHALYVERGERTLRFLEIDPATGAAREVITESGPSYRESNLDYGAIPNIYVYEETGDIIWFSERDGYGHLYLYDTNGGLTNQVTKGDWVVRTLEYVDEGAGWIYFTAGGREAGRDPYYHHLYRIHPDGTGLALLTPEDADHEITFAPDGSCFVDSFSRVDMPPVTVVRSPDGTMILELERGDISSLTALCWKPPERITVKARDGITDLYGLVFYPTSFDPGRTYPVVDSVYPGPQCIVTSKPFPSKFDWNGKVFWKCQSLSELGFIVVTIDGMGTPFRSKAFHDVSYGHMGDAGGLADHIGGITQLAAGRPYMDLERVGIYGHSGGGFMTAQAMLTYPGFYKVGVASAGNHDNWLYESLWGEKYEGMPDGENYLEQVTSLKAANLTGDLLIVTGDMDDNVHPSMTMQLVDALVQQNRTFDMLVLPNRNHEFNYDPYFMKRQFDYFVLHLMERQPPEYVFQVPWISD